MDILIFFCVLTCTFWFSKEATFGFVDLPYCVFWTILARKDPPPILCRTFCGTSLMAHSSHMAEGVYLPSLGWLGVRVCARPHMDPNIQHAVKTGLVGVNHGNTWETEQST